MNVIDLIATNIPDLLKKLNGRKVGDKTLKTAGAEVVDIPMTAGENFFQLFWQPEVMMLLMLIAIYGIIARIEPSGRDFSRRRGRAGPHPPALHVGHAAAQRRRGGVDSFGRRAVRD